MKDARTPVSAECWSASSPIITEDQIEEAIEHQRKQIWRTQS